MRKNLVVDPSLTSRVIGALQGPPGGRFGCRIVLVQEKGGAEESYDRGKG
jgi:hypothetical protein